MLALFKRPSAFLPLVLSAVLLVLIGVRLLRFGVVPDADEGAEAHLFQLLMPTQLFIMLFFAARWLPRRRRAALAVLALQAAGAATVLAAVFLLKW